MTNRRRSSIHIRLAATLVVGAALVAPAGGASTQFLKISGRAGFEAGERDNVVITGFGEVRLARSLSEILANDGTIASVDALVEGHDGVIYVGTTAHGKLLALTDDKASTLAEFGEAAGVTALAVDAGGDVLIGVSGERAEIHRLRRGQQKPERICTLNDAQYVWSIAAMPDGKALVGTGPNGLLYRVDPATSTSEVVHDSEEDNLRSVAVHNDVAYVGTDPNGLVLRIDSAIGKATVIHDAAENEVSSLLIDPQSGAIYAGTSQLVEATPEGPAAEETSTGRATPSEGAAAGLDDDRAAEPARPDPDARPGELDDAAVALPEPQDSHGTMATTTRPAGTTTNNGPRPMPGSAGETIAVDGNAVYRITSQGFASEVFRGPAMIHSIASRDGSLYIATGPAGEVHEINLATENHMTIVRSRDRNVTSLLLDRAGRLWLGSANSAGVARLSEGLASTGTFESGALDAQQVATFGKMQVRGAVPEGTSLTLSTRSGNVADVRSEMWSEWSEAVPAARFVIVPTPAGRYVQVRATLTGDGKQSPTLDELSLAFARPNVAPRIESVSVASTTPTGDAPPSTERQISWMATDADGDEMRFNIAIRTGGADQPWITLARDLTEVTHAWDTRQFADGRYDVRVEANDLLANAPGLGLTSTRYADAVDVDNTPPTIGDISVQRSKGKVTVQIRAVDRGGMIASLESQLDGAKGWQRAAASDNLDDSPDERYEIVLPDPGAATRVLSLRCRDSSGNTAYASVTIRPEK